jgi:hypothetical protein
MHYVNNMVSGPALLRAGYDVLRKGRSVSIHW